MSIELSPIVVSGPGRCGSTWMQYLLTAHPDCFIHGQLGGKLSVARLAEILEELHDASNRAEKSNGALGYSVPHYCGSPRKRTMLLFRDFVQRYITGYGEPECFGRRRWGMKWIGSASNPEERDWIEELWPDCLWIICLREPFTAAVSLANTFGTPTLDTVRKHLEAWVRSVEFLRRDSPRVIGFLMDRTAALDPLLRRVAIRSIVSHVRLEQSAEVDEFVDRWEVVHKAKPDDKRTFQISDDDRSRLLDETEGLAESIDRLGYLEPCPAA